MLVSLRIYFNDTFTVARLAVVRLERTRLAGTEDGSSLNA